MDATLFLCFQQSGGAAVAQPTTRVGLDSRVLIRFGYGLLRDKLSASVCDRIVQAVSSMIRFSEFRHIWHYRPKKYPASGPNEPSGNRRRGKGGTGIPNRSCHFFQTSRENTPGGACSSILRNSSCGT